MTFDRTVRVTSKFMAAGLAALSTGAALAQSPAQAWLDNRFVVNLGAFVFGTDARARLDGEFQAGEEIDFDEEFDVGNNATRWRADALWRITPRHQLRLGTFTMSNSGSSVIDRDIAWGDYTFKAEALVEATLDADVYTLSYEYAFVRQPSYEIAAVIGVHYSDVELTLSGRATLTGTDGSVIEDEYARRSASAPVPLPLLGVRGSWAVAPRWVLEAGATYFKASHGDVDGYWSDLRVGATWMYNEHLGVGAGYSRFRTNVDVDRDSFKGSLSFGYSGFQLYLTGTF